MTNGKHNGSTPIWIALISVVGLFLGLHYFSLSRTAVAVDCAQEAREVAVRVEEREDAHFDEIIRRLDRIEEKLDG